MKLQSSALRLAQRLFLWLGVAALAYFVGTATYAGLYQRYENWKFEHRQFDIPEYMKPDTMGTSVDVTKATLSAGMRFPGKAVRLPTPADGLRCFQVIAGLFVASQRSDSRILPVASAILVSAAP
jgi:hypothetical protein